MAREPSLPPLPAITGSRQLKSLAKRRIEYEPSSSSDPPLFSSDDHDVLEDEAIPARRKRQYRGTWWDTDPATSSDPRQKRTFKRAMDSGVWMGSDSSEASLYDALPPPASSPTRLVCRSPVVALRTEPAAMAGLDSYNATDTPASRSSPLGPQACAEMIVQRCLDDGIERVDLSDLQLASLSNSVLKPLKYMTKQTNVHPLPPSQDGYSSLVPNLHLFLSRNLLRRVPGEVFKLDNLVVLSLRNNKLTELPPAIGYLTGLLELNVGGNKLRSLPWELLSLLPPKGALKTLNLFPNPFLDAPTNYDDHSHSTSPLLTAEEEALDPAQRTALLMTRWKPIRLSRTPVVYCNIDGSRCQKPRSSLVSSLPSVVSSYYESEPTTLEGGSCMPSLLELTLKACSKSAQLSQLPDLLPIDGPESLPRLLREAETIRDFGGQTCSVCRKAFIVKRTEWLEWWECVPLIRGGGAIPLIRRGCSWRCSPQDEQHSAAYQDIAAKETC